MILCLLEKYRVTTISVNLIKNKHQGWVANSDSFNSNDESEDNARSKSIKKDIKKLFP